MPEVKSVKPVPVAKGKRHLAQIVILVVCLVALWHVHPWLLRKAIRVGAMKAAEEAGITLQIGEIQADLSRPFLAQDIQLEQKNTATALRLRSAKLEINSLWDILFRSGRIFKSLQIDGLTGVLDFRTAASLPKGEPGPAQRPAASLPAGQENKPVLPLRLLPLEAGGTDLDVQFLADHQVYDVTGASFTFNEAELGKFKARSVSARVGSLRETFSSVKGTTAWRNGSVYLASLALRPDVRIDNLSANLVNPGAVSLRLDAQIFGGVLSGDARLGRTGGGSVIDGAAWASNVDLSPLSTVPGVNGKITGLLREGRLTFRGNPGRAAQSEASLRIVADDFRWNDRGWQSLEIAASMIHSRLAVTQFVLRQKDNMLSASGEISVDKGCAAIAHSPLRLNITGSINQIGELSSLLGGPFSEMTGRMSLDGTLNGQADDLNGYLNMEASQARFRSLPVNSVRVETVFRHTEAQIARLEVWSGKDSVTGDGTIGLNAPHHYSGELNMTVNNLATYLAPFRAPKAESVYSGALGVQWQGDGTFTANSGAFNIKLRDFVSVATPAGMTGQFAGTYAPQNVYLGTLELSHGPLHFSSHTSAAAGGITLKDVELNNGKEPVAKGEVYFPINVFALVQGKPWREAVLPGQAIYGQIASSKDISLKDLLQLAGREEKFEGTLSGKISASNTLDEPHMDGSLTLKDGSIPALPHFPGAAGIESVVRFEGQTATIDHMHGQMAGGVFQVGGTIGFKNLADPDWNLTFNGSNLLLVHNARLRLTGGMDLTASGNNEAGKVGGSIHFDELRLTGWPKLALLPAATMPAPALPDTGFVPKPFADWKLDVAITKDTVLFFGNDATTGRLVSDARMSGPVANPLASGQIRMTGVPVRLPGGATLTSDGSVSFGGKEPGFDIQGKALIAGYQIRMHTNGRELTLSSQPPLAKAPLLLLIDSGIGLNPDTDLGSNPLLRTVNPPSSLPALPNGSELRMPWTLGFAE